MSNTAWLWDGSITNGDSLRLPEKTFVEGGIYAVSIAMGISKGWQVGEALEKSSIDDYSRAVLWHGAEEILTVAIFHIFLQIKVII